MGRAIPLPTLRVLVACIGRTFTFSFIVEMQLLKFEYKVTNRYVNPLYIRHVAVCFVWHLISSCCVLSNISVVSKSKISIFNNITYNTDANSLFVV